MASVLPHLVSLFLKFTFVSELSPSSGVLFPIISGCILLLAKPVSAPVSASYSAALFTPKKGATPKYRFMFETIWPWSWSSKELSRLWVWQNYYAIARALSPL